MILFTKSFVLVQNLRGVGKDEAWINSLEGIPGEWP